MIELLALDQSALEAVLVDLGYPAYRGRQVYQWLYHRGAAEFDLMTDLPRDLRAKLKSACTISLPQIVATRESADGETVKFLLSYADGVNVEAVLMRYRRGESRNRNTLCLSTQAGCAMDCAFCASSILGLTRNLQAGEIVAQMLIAQQYLREHDLGELTNLVYMGMGEPLANWSQVWASIELANSALHIGMRRITVSTCGLVPAIRKLAGLKAQFTLAVSLHSPDNDVRSRLMPVNRRYPIEELFTALDEYTAATGRRVTIEYALFKGLNDDSGPALARLLKGRLVHVNLILANPVPERGLEPPAASKVKAFTEALEAQGVSFVFRESRGLDIDGACGQLRQSYEKLASPAGV